MKVLFLFIFLFPIASFCQNKKFVFYSDLQLNKTFDGSKQEGHRKATIIFSDPKSITIEGTDFDKLPKGYMAFKFEGVNQVREDIVFIKSSKGLDVYGITKTEVGNDIIYLSKHTHKVGNKSYDYTIMWGKTNEKDMWGTPQMFTTFHCTMANK